MPVPSQPHDCGAKAKECVCPKAPCGHRLQMICPTRGCRAIVGFASPKREANVLCGQLRNVGMALPARTLLNV